MFKGEANSSQNLDMREIRIMTSRTGNEATRSSPN